MNSKKASLVCVEEEQEEEDYCIEMEPFPPPQKTEFESQNTTNTQIGFARSLSLFASRSFRHHTTNATTNSCRFSSFDLPKEKQSKQSKQSKQFWLAQRFKASQAFIKSLFTSTGCSEKSSTNAANKAVNHNHKPMCQECQIQNQNKNNDAKRNSFERFYDKPRRSYSVTKRIDCDMVEDNRRRVSFSGVFQRHCGSKASSLSNPSSGTSSLSSSFSLSSSGSNDLQFRRSFGVNSGVESSIEDAIAHCKQSQLKNGDD